MKNKKRFLRLTAIFVATLVVAVGALVLITSNNDLAVAARNSNTITINAEYDAATHTLTANQTVEYKNRTGSALESVKFHIYATAYRDGAKYAPVSASEVPKAYPNGKNFGNIEIKSLAVNGQSANIIIEGEDSQVLSVPVSAGLQPNKTANIEIGYSVTLANIKHRLGWTDRIVNLGNFYPVPCVFEDGNWQTYPYSYNGDPFYNDLHNFNVTLTTDKTHKVASSGTLASETEAGSKTTWTFNSSAIRDFAIVLSPAFKTLTRMSDKIAVNYFYLDDKEPEKSITAAIDALTTFSRLFTPYPYKQLTVVETDFAHGGMEYGELVYIASDIEDHDYYKQVIVHEVAHQWWYGTVGNNQTRTAWIDEGLAEYSTVLFFDQNPQYNISAEKMVHNAKTNYSEYVKIVNSVNGKLDMQMNRDLNSFNSSYEYVFMTYVRGMLLFANLEKVVGKEQALAALKSYASEAQFSFATQERLVASFEKSTKQKLGVFFTSFLNGVPA